MKLSSRIEFVVAALLVFATLVGCSSEPAQTESDSQKESHPKLSFHRPKDLSSAVNRLQEIHESLDGVGALPPPIQFEYVEVIHGEGSSAHSHYYLASEFQSGGNDHDQHEDHHGEMKETVERRTMKVDLRTELEDLVAWLPDIAANTDLKESDWNLVKTSSQELQGIIDAISDDVTESKFRSAWNKQTTKVTGLLAELQQVAKKAGGDLP